MINSLPAGLEGLLAGLFGLLIGSFLNVCIHRWPRDLSVVSPRSMCPNCEKQIAWYDNIPVLSFLLLRGRCRACGESIDWRYPLVELLTGSVFAYFAWRHGFTIGTLKDCVFAAILIGLVFADLETLLLPDELTLGGSVLGLVFALLIPVDDTTFRLISSLLGYAWGPAGGSFGEAVLGAALPAGSIWLGGWIFEKLRHKEGLGFGDVKMLVMIGAFLGLRGALLTIILASLAGSVVGLVFIKATGKDAGSYQLPFGTFLGGAAFVVLVDGQNLIDWYTRLLG